MSLKDTYLSLYISETLIRPASKLYIPRLPEKVSLLKVALAFPKCSDVKLCEEADTGFERGFWYTQHIAI